MIQFVSPHFSGILLRKCFQKVQTGGAGRLSSSTSVSTNNFVVCLETWNWYCHVNNNHWANMALSDCRCPQTDAMVEGNSHVSLCYCENRSTLFPENVWMKSSLNLCPKKGRRDFSKLLSLLSNGSNCGRKLTRLSIIVETVSRYIRRMYFRPDSPFCDMARLSCWRHGASNRPNRLKY